MKYVIMSAGKGTRWNNYLGLPKHLIKINGETLLGRTTRLLKENGITNYVITTSDNRYKQYGNTKEQTYNDCEVDRFDPVRDKEICYLYGDVYYTEEAIKTIIETPTDEILFFGSDYEIFAIKIVDKKLFMKHKDRVKKLYLENQIDRCIGWEVYKSLNNIPLNDYAITDRYYLIEDETDDIDYPEDYIKFIRKYEGGENVIKCEVINQNLEVREWERLKNIKRLKSNDEITQPNFFEIGDTFETDEEFAKYLSGETENQPLVCIKVLEIIPEEKKKTTNKKVNSKKK